MRYAFGAYLAISPYLMPNAGRMVVARRRGAFAPFVRPTLQSDPWRHDRGRIVS